MKISKQAKRGARALFHSCLANGTLDSDRVRQAVGRVVAAKPRGYLPMLVQFQRLVRLDIQRRTARVESAVPLSGAMQAAIQANLTRRYGPGLNFVLGQNPELLGGVRIRVGSDVYDGSIQSRLNALAESF